MKEYREITDPVELFQLKKEGAEIEVCWCDGIWGGWIGQMWNDKARFRLVTEKVPKKVKVLAYVYSDGEVRWAVDGTEYQIRQLSNYATRIPALDMEYEE